MATRAEGRAADALRPIEVQTGFVDGRSSNVLYCSGQTRVICVATFAEDTPAWLSKGGWLTAEYSLLPYSVAPRASRNRGKIDGRTTEIQRLIGRTLRASLDLDAMPNRAIHIDCDVLVADGGTRTAAISGATIALNGLVQDALAAGFLKQDPRIQPVYAVSCGVVDGELLLDLDYHEDSRAELDINIVGTANGELVEIQGTSESQPIAREQWNGLIDLGLTGIASIARSV